MDTHEISSQRGHEHLVTIHVNNQPVHISEKRTTGLEIKRAAIAQGVTIQPNFQLLEELGGGRTKVIGDDDHIEIHAHSRFVALAPDDNS